MNMKHLPLAIPLATMLTVGDSPPFTTKDWLINAGFWIVCVGLWLWWRK